MKSSALKVAKKVEENTGGSWNIVDAFRRARAAAFANAMVAPQTSITMTVLYSISFPVRKVLSQWSKISET